MDVYLISSHYDLSSSKKYSSNSSDQVENKELYLSDGEEELHLLNENESTHKNEIYNVIKDYYLPVPGDDEYFDEIFGDFLGDQDS